MPKRPEWVTLWKKMESGSSAQGTISSAPEVRGEILISFQLIPIEEVLKVTYSPTNPDPNTQPLAIEEVLEVCCSLTATAECQNAQCPMPHATCRMPHAHCPKPTARCPLPACLQVPLNDITPLMKDVEVPRDSGDRLEIVEIASRWP